MNTSLTLEPAFALWAQKQPERCEVDENGSHGSDVGWGQKIGMYYRCNCGTTQSMRDYFLKSPQEVMVASEMGFALFNVRKIGLFCWEKMVTI